MSEPGVRAFFHDGRTSRARPATMFLAPGGVLLVLVDGEEAAREFVRGEVRIESRLGSSPRFVRLPGDQRCEVSDHDALDAAIAGWGRADGSARAAIWLNRVEQNWRLVVGATAALLLVVWAAFAYGVPFAARHVSAMLPEKIVHGLGDETLATFDKVLFEPSRLSVARREELGEKFAALMRRAGEAGDYRVEFRASPKTGANAFALPSGVIVMTDELVALAENDEQILGVLAHEAGHVRHRHLLRGVLQNATVAVVVTFVTGDVSAAGAAAAAAPAFLMQSRFSREFEREADMAAVSTLRRAGLDPDHLARLLELLTEHHRPGTGKTADGRELMDYVSSHPPTSERLKAIREGEGTD